LRGSGQYGRLLRRGGGAGAGRGGIHRRRAPPRALPWHAV